MRITLRSIGGLLRSQHAPPPGHAEPTEGTGGRTGSKDTASQGRPVGLEASLRPVLASVLARVDHAEEVALGVLQHDEVLAWLGRPWMAARSEPGQPLDLRLLVPRVEVQVQAILTDA